MSRELEFSGYWEGDAVYSCDNCGAQQSFPFDSEDVGSKEHRKELREKLGWITTKVASPLNKPTLTTPSEWVSVDERSPDKPGHYLVCTSINYWHGGCMDVNQEHKYHDSGTPVGYDGTTMSVLDCYYDITGDWNRVCNKHVTHWMPLPEPPEKEE